MTNPTILHPETTTFTLGVIATHEADPESDMSDDRQGERVMRAERRETKSRDKARRVRKKGTQTARDPRERNMPEPKPFKGYEHPNQRMYRERDERLTAAIERYLASPGEVDMHKLLHRAWSESTDEEQRDQLLALLQATGETSTGAIVALVGEDMPRGSWMVGELEGDRRRLYAVQRPWACADERRENPSSLDILLRGHPLFVDHFVLADAQTTVSEVFLQYGLFARVGWAGPVEIDRVLDAGKFHREERVYDDLTETARSREHEVESRLESDSELHALEHLWRRKRYGLAFLPTNRRR